MYRLGKPSVEERATAKAGSAKRKGIDREVKQFASEGRKPPRAAVFERYGRGRVSVRGQSGSWAFGEFIPSPQFSDFAPVFAQWSLLMHAQDADGRLNAAAAEKLRASEYELDALRALLVLDNPEERHQLRQLNIDGCLIEWKL